MGFFSFFKSDNRFVTEKKYKKNVSKQKKINDQTLDQLSKCGVTNSSELKLEFFFYTNEQNKASNLAIELKKLTYSLDKVDTAEGNRKQWLVSGWSTKMKMDLNTVTAWTSQMCKLGFDNDCDFDGWGTMPDQNIEIEKDLTAEQYYDKAHELFEQGKLRQSELYFSESIKLNSSFVKSFYNRAMVRTELGNTQQALEDYMSEIKLNPNYNEAYGNSGAIKDDLGDYDGAISDYNQAIKINPKDAIAYGNRGNSKFRKGDRAGACADWNKALELGDTDVQSRLEQYCK